VAELSLPFLSQIWDFCPPYLDELVSALADFKSRCSKAFLVVISAGQLEEEALTVRSKLMDRGVPSFPVSTGPPGHWRRRQSTRGHTAFSGSPTKQSHPQTASKDRCGPLRDCPKGVGTLLFWGVPRFTSLPPGLGIPGVEREGQDNPKAPPSSPESVVSHPLLTIMPYYENNV